MIGFELITGFDWDAGNERKNVEAHQVCQIGLCHRPAVGAEAGRCVRDPLPEREPHHPREHQHAEAPRERRMVPRARHVA